MKIKVNKALYDWVKENYQNIPFKEWPGNFKKEFNSFRHLYPDGVSYQSRWNNNYYSAGAACDCFEEYHYKFSSIYDYELV